MRLIRDLCNLLVYPVTIRRDSHVCPIIQVLLLVSVIIRIMEALPDVIINIQMILVDIVPHVHVCEDVLQLLIVVIRDGCEWIE